jgi:hypothetical protein
MHAVVSAWPTSNTPKMNSPLAATAAALRLTARRVTSTASAHSCRSLHGTAALRAAGAPASAPAPFPPRVADELWPTTAALADGLLAGDRAALARSITLSE